MSTARLVFRGALNSVEALSLNFSHNNQFIQAAIKHQLCWVLWEHRGKCDPHPKFNKSDFHTTEPGYSTGVDAGRFRSAR